MNTRERAFKAILEVEESKGYSNIIANKYSKGLEKRDISLLRELIYGTLENSIYYEWIISKFSKTSLRKIDKEIKTIMKVAIHQIMSLDRIPDSAAVNEAVKLANKYSNRWVKGYVNGVLRNISRNKKSIGYPDRCDLKKHLSIRYSCPEWLVALWLGDYGPEFTEQLLDANQNRHYMNIRVNSLKTDNESLLSLLKEYGYEVEESEYSNSSFKLMNPTGILDTDLYRGGLFDIQDVSSSIAAEAACPKEGDHVLDLCAAPGGKTVYIASLMNNKGFVKARDIYAHKIAELREKSERLGVQIVETELSDATVFSEEDTGIWDICVADVPCSALGLIRNKPEIKLIRREEDLEIFPKIQKQILNNAAKYLKKGGTLIYSTCTVNRKENIDIINNFLKENKNYKLEGFENCIKKSGISKQVGEGYIQLFPNIHGTNGFFIAKLKKF